MAEITAGQQSMKNAATQIRSAYATLDEDLQQQIAGGETPIINIGVTYDGTWQKRGFSSLYGVGICIDIMTGLVIDYELMSKYCQSCKNKEAEGCSEEQWTHWIEQHEADCHINHRGSSKAMEQQAAKIIWSRSVERHKLRYTEMLSDGDSTSFAAIVDLQPYGPDVSIAKLECINHAGKRLGTALRSLAKREHLGGCGTGKLTDKKIMTLQRYYRAAIKTSGDNVEMMRSLIWAALFHSASTDESANHRYCPDGVNSWCVYRKAEALQQPVPAHNAHQSTTYLNPIVAERMIPIYERMTNNTLLKRMTHGKTQNQNESLNSTIWARCLKTTFLGKDRIEAAIGSSIGKFNVGAQHLVDVMNQLWIDISVVTIDGVRQKDKRRLQSAAKSATPAAKKNRRARKEERFATRRYTEQRERPSYGAGIAD